MKLTEKLQQITTKLQASPQKIAEFVRQNQIKVTALLAFAGLAPEMQSQTIPGGPGIRIVPVKTFNALDNNGNHVDNTDRLEVHTRTMNAIFGQEKYLQHLTPICYIVDDNFDILQQVDPPSNTYTILFDSSLDPTTTRFRNWLIANNYPTTGVNLLLPNRSFSDAVGIAAYINQDYHTIGISSNGMINYMTTMTHEAGHTWGGSTTWGLLV